MSKKTKHTGFAVALAWPETWCKQPGAWYDKTMSLLGINKHHYYQVGHAAVILINSADGVCHYFDFGRYHTPYQYGRVRNRDTDNDLEITTIAEISGNQIRNFETILNEISVNPSCHGSGKLIASYTRIQFGKAFQKAKILQKRGILPYGPFVLNGTNCSRFVRTVILAGEPESNARFRLLYPPMLSVTPAWNVYSLGKKFAYPQDEQKGVFNHLPEQFRVDNVLPPPIKNKHIPPYSKWLAGEGAGSWYAISSYKNGILVIRYNPDGKIESQGLFTPVQQRSADLQREYDIAYLSHDNMIHLLQSGERHRYQRKFIE